MSDTISRQAAIDYFVTNVGFHDEDGYPIEDECELRDIWTGYFDGIPSAEPHWIPVTERLPKDDVFVLLTVRRMDDSYNHVPFISTGYISWNHQCWWCAHDGNCKDANVEVLAWMPLPEPYKEVTE